MIATIIHDGTITCRCETCVERQLDEQPAQTPYSEASLRRFDQVHLSADNAQYLSDLRDKHRKQERRRA